MAVLSSLVPAEKARIWDAQTGLPASDNIVHYRRVSSGVFSPDSRRILTTENHIAHIWDARTGTPGPSMSYKCCNESLHQGVITSAAFSPDGRRVLTISADQGPRVWNADTGQLLDPPIPLDPDSNYVAFSRDGTRVLAIGENKIVWVWDIGVQDGWLVGDSNRKVSDAAFSPDGNLVLTISGDNAVRVWHTKSGRPAGPPLQHRSAVSSARFSPDGTRVLTVSGNMMQIWQAQPET